MPFQKYAPGKPYVSSQPSPLRAIDIVKVPDGKSAKEEGQPKGNHPPHGLQNGQISLGLRLGPAASVGSSGGRLPTITSAFIVRRTSPSGTKTDFHKVHASSEDHDGKERVCVLMKERILKVMIVQGDEEG